MGGERKFMQAIATAKARIDNGFSRLGPRIDVSRPADRALAVLAGRLIAMGNAVVLLSGHELANEAAPLLVSMAAACVHMRWIANKEAEKRASIFLEESKDASRGWPWDRDKLQNRALEAGFGSLWMETLDGLCREHGQGSLAGLPWGHALAESRAGLSADKVLRVAAAAACEGVNDLRRYWPEHFDSTGLDQALEEKNGG